jgi:phosphate butyryltransferase
MNETHKVVAIVGSVHVESLRTMQELRSKEDIEFTLFGNEKETRQLAKDLKIDLQGVSIIDTDDEDSSCRKAAAAAGEGTVHVLMKGSVHTASFLHAILDKQLGLLPEGTLLSHIARLELPWYHKPLFLTDAAVSILPDLEKKVLIVQNALMVARAAHVARPKVALVCPVETVNPKIVSTTDASQIAFLHKNTDVFGDAEVEGPFALDVALSKDAARTKGIEGEVPGDADILVLGNMDAANATYKAFLSAPSVQSASIVVGAKIPIVLTSRSETMKSRMTSVRFALSVAAG